MTAPGEPGPVEWLTACLAEVVPTFVAPVPGQSWAHREAAGGALLRRLLSNPVAFRRLRSAALGSTLRRRLGQDDQDVARWLRELDGGVDSPVSVEGEEEDALPFVFHADGYLPFTELADRAEALFESDCAMWGDVVGARPRRPLGFLCTLLGRRAIARVRLRSGARRASPQSRVDPDSHHYVAQCLDVLRELQERARAGGGVQALARSHELALAAVHQTLGAGGADRDRLAYVLRKLYPRHALDGAWGSSAPITRWVERQLEQAWAEAELADWEEAWAAIEPGAPRPPSAVAALATLADLRGPERSLSLGEVALLVRVVGVPVDPVAVATMGRAISRLGRPAETVVLAHLEAAREVVADLVREHE